MFLNMLRYSYLVLFITLCFAYNVYAEFPEDPKPCKYGDSECMTKVINYLLHEKNQGDDSLNLMKIDPLKTTKIQLKQGAESPVNIDLVFTNNDIIGLSTAKVLKVSGFGKNLAQKHEIVLKIKTLQLIGDYTINGKILLLPIRGSGKSNITMVNPTLIVKVFGTPVEKEDGTFMNINKFSGSAEPERMIFKIDNLFNGDKILGDNMNLFLNENWADIYKELKKSVSTEFGKIFSGVINQVFTKYPYNKYFIE